MHRMPVGLALVAACMSAVLLLGARPVAADIISLNATYLETSFSTSGGDYNKGVLTISDLADIVMEDNLGQSTFDDGFFQMIVSLFDDSSLDDLASAEFRTGTLTLKDSLDQDLLTGTVDQLLLTEVSGLPDLVVGQGTFTVTGGSLESSFGADYGEIIQITFRMKPGGIVNFSSGFTAQTDITLTPIPEPATLALLAMGALVLVSRKRNRR